MAFRIKIFRLINLLFIIELVVLSLGLKLRMFSYGKEVQGAMTELIIMIALVLSVISFFLLSNPQSKAKRTMVVVVGLVMVIAGAALVLENSFKLLI